MSARTRLAAGRGGGPLRMIADDETRAPGERACAQALVGFMTRQQAMHGKPMQLQGDVTLSYAQLKLLFHVPFDEPVALGRIAEQAGITPAALTQALGPIEEAGLVLRERSSADKRVVEARMTERGRDALDGLRASFDERWRGVLESLTDQELAVAARVLERMADLFGPQS